MELKFLPEITLGLGILFILLAYCYVRLKKRFLELSSKVKYFSDKLDSETADKKALLNDVFKLERRIDQLKNENALLVYNLYPNLFNENIEFLLLNDVSDYALKRLLAVLEIEEDKDKKCSEFVRNKLNEIIKKRKLQST